MHQVVSNGSPYDHNALLTCPHCIDALWAFRWELCDQYGWEQWPVDLNKGYEMRMR